MTITPTTAADPAKTIAELQREVAAKDRYIDDLEAELHLLRDPRPVAAKPEPVPPVCLWDFLGTSTSLTSPTEPGAEAGP